MSQETINFIVKIMGAGVAIVPLFATVFVVNAAAQGLGKLGGWLTDSRRGQGFKQKAQDYKDYRKTLRQADALSGTQRVFGGAWRYKRQQNKQLRNQAAQAQLQSAQAQFGVANPTANKYVQATAQSQAQTSAINSATGATFVKSVVTNPNLISQGMGLAAAADPEVKKALDAQQERAIAEAIKDVELTADIAPGAVGKMADELKNAIATGDSITARAMQNMLLKSGAAGQSAYRDTMNGVTPANMARGADGKMTKTGETVTALKRNMLANHSDIKASAADLVRHASMPEGSTMYKASGDPRTWKMSNEELVKQKTHSLETAKMAGGISQKQAREIKDDMRLYQRLDPDGQKVIDDIAL